jgi:hypothetical protein
MRPLQGDNFVVIKSVKISKICVHLTTINHQQLTITPN